MKHLKLIIIGILLSCVAFSQNSLLKFSEDNKILIVDLEYHLSTDSPILLAPYQAFSFQADSMYLVNRNRMNFYRQLHESVLSQDDLKNGAFLINEYETYLLNQEGFLDRLTDLLSKNQLITNSIVEKGEAAFVEINKELETTTTLLSNSRIHLEKMEKLYEKSTKRSFGDFLKPFLSASIGAALVVLVLN